jgi:putative phage-type endonuclease
MQILEIIQGTEEWKNLRFSKITGTDASILTGSNIWKSRLELWEQKLQLREPDKVNEKMARGSLLEEPARLLLNELVGIEFKPVVALSDTYPYMMASLDGISPCGRYMCEIKCPGTKGHEAAINGVIAPYYIDQMNHCLLVSGCEIY